MLMIKLYDYKDKSRKYMKTRRHMENIILSLLLIKSMTVYEMKMFIQQNLSSVCSDSFGSIQAGIKNLIKKDCIVVREFTENGLAKKEYSITNQGLAQFQSWIQEPMNLLKNKNMEEGKFFFLGMAKKEIRIQSIQGYIDCMKFELMKFYKIQEYVEEKKETAIQTNVERIAKDKQLAEHLVMVSGEKTLTDAVQNIYNYQMYNLEYALKRLQDDIEFYEKILSRENNK